MNTWTNHTEGRLDKLIAEALPQFSRSKHQQFIEQGFVTVNSAVVTQPKHLVKVGDVLTFEEPILKTEPTAEARTLDILYEDETLIVINKPTGMVVHPNKPEETGSLVQALLHYHPALKEVVYDPSKEISRLRPGIVHRLDKDTSGVIVVAKTTEALHNLAKQFQEHTTSKEYRTVLYGNLKETTEVDAPIKRKGGAKQNLMGASHKAGDGREALSIFTPLTQGENFTFTNVVIKTGRTHQIRVHAKFIGHPVLGDALYGNKPSLSFSQKHHLTHQLLHAAQLTLTHPITGKVMTFEAPLPDSFTPFIQDS